MNAVGWIDIVCDSYSTIVSIITIQSVAGVAIARNSSVLKVWRIQLTPIVRIGVACITILRCWYMTVGLTAV
jgi:hypothetical protein